MKKKNNYNKNTQIFFHRASKINKGEPEPKIEESIAERVELKNNRISVIKKEEKNIKHLLFKYYFTNYQNPSDIYKNGKTRSSIFNQKILDQVKEKIKNMPENKVDVIEENENIVERIFYFNQLEQSGGGLKILTLNQMLSRLPIT